jgi:UDP-N-acetylmuramoylalanine--D-glutamate ligase
VRDHLAGVWGAATCVEKCPDLESAVRRAHVLSRPGQTVLLSPGTSSFDMFAGYEQRGEAFIRAVQRLLSPV